MFKKVPNGVCVRNDLRGDSPGKIHQEVLPEAGIHVHARRGIEVRAENGMGGQIAWSRVSRGVQVAGIGPGVQELLQRVRLPGADRVAGIVEIHEGMSRIAHVQAGNDNGVVRAIPLEKILPRKVRIPYFA